MADPIKAFVAIDAGLSRESVELSLPRGGDVDVVGLVEGLDEAWMTLQEVPNDVLVIACAGHSEKALVLIDGAIKQRPSRPVVVFGHGSPNGFVNRVFQAGADDVLVLPQDPEAVRFALEKAIARKTGGTGASPGSQGHLVCVLGPKGGTGKTLVATSLAVTLAQMGKHVALVDLDLQFGDVGLCMGLRPERTIYDLVRTGGSLDEEKMSDFLVTHHSGVEVLIAPSRPDHASVISIEFLRDVYGVLRRMVDYVVVDTPPGFTPEVIATIDASSDLVMVGTLDSLSLKNTKLGLETLSLMDYDPRKIRLVLNRADTRVGISHHDVVTVLGSEPEIFIPSDREIPRSVNEGVPITLSRPQSYAAASFHELAALFTGAESHTVAEPVARAEAAAGAPRRSLFRLRRS
jgi:pilus assembly protein CpaE